MKSLQNIPTNDIENKWMQEFRFLYIRWNHFAVSDNIEVLSQWNQYMQSFESNKAFKFQAANKWNIFLNVILSISLMIKLFIEA